ncbi:hypothetical protein AB2M62_03055 [Sphingomonas sp. MMS12-HWE2-04]|uniref:hypothetical protein n=1 Tax=Sphingomonas sp. MMS12-HWE2-04 TaxID=3234199 RepID=UPI00384DBDDB
MTGSRGSEFVYREIEMDLIVSLPLDQWARWLDCSVPAQEVLGVLSKGSLEVSPVPPPPPAPEVAAQGELL